MTTDVLSDTALRAQPVMRLPLFRIAVCLAIALCFLLQSHLPWIAAYPGDWTLPVTRWINAAASWLVGNLQPVTRAVSGAIDTAMRGLQAVLLWLPWPALAAGTLMAANRAGGLRLAVFAAAVIAYILLSGYWLQAMNTLVLVAIAVPLAIGCGFALGALTQPFRMARKPVEACLDMMQTIPAFAYLIPLLLLFGFGPVSGLMASALFALPAMVRNTWLGLDLVPQTLKEAGVMGGCTRLQRFLHVELPTALPQIMVGVNQTTLAVFSMIIVATIIGGFNDIGWEVLNATRMVALGKSLLSGLVIALMAILIDRITKGLTERAAPQRQGGTKGDRRGRAVAIALVACFIGAVVLRVAAPALDVLQYPLKGVITADRVDAWLLGFLSSHAGPITAIKNGIMYGILLPLRIGVAQTAVPAIWGVTLHPWMLITGAAAILLAAALATRLSDWRVGGVILAAAVTIFVGVSNIPWPIVILLVTALGWRIGGWKVAAFAGGSLAFILAAGLWKPLMLSVYLCGLAVILCLVIGGALGLMAASSDRFSRMLRPVNDTLQTVPQFVFLIPALMFFKVGDITALIAVMLYAIVPPIRYVEHGLRTIRPDALESARQMGCTPSQLLWRVRLPLALPVIMLGVNQTIMAALSMLAIAAMVGTRDLGQQVYIALGKADPGLGLTAGIAIALLAMTSDRLTKAWIASRQR